MAEIFLVLGGTRSGKTSFAESLARSFEKPGGPPVTYVATAEAKDQEMARRIEMHREARPRSWKTCEEPLYPSRFLDRLVKESSALILDCFTLLITNHIMAEEGASPEKLEKTVLSEIKKILDIADAGPAPLIIVSNEVGVGLLSPYELGRLFQDLLGRVHQLTAARATEVYFLVAGLPQRIK